MAVSRGQGERCGSVIEAESDISLSLAVAVILVARPAMDDVDYPSLNSTSGASRILGDSPDVDTHSCRLLGPIALVSFVADFGCP